MPDKLIVDKVRKHAGSEVWVVLETYQGQVRCHVREYFWSEDESEWLPSKKGVSIPPESVGAAVDAVERLSASTTIGEVAAIPLGQKAKISFGIWEFNRHQYAEIRVYYRNGSDSAEWKHGKGATLPPAMLPKLAEALRVAEDELERFGASFQQRDE